MNQIGEIPKTVFTKERDKKYVGVIQLSRIGDVLQTCQVYINYKQKNKDAYLVLIARKKFAQPLEFITKKYFNKIIYLDFDNYINNSNNLNEFREYFYKTLSEINSVKFDTISNLTFSRTSSLLCSLINSDVRTGPCLNSSMALTIEDQWSQYLYANVLGNKLNPFALVDIYKRIIGENGWQSNISSPLAISKQNLIVIHPFASHERKYWKAEKWREVIYKVLKDNHDIRIIIVGAQSELIHSKKMLEGPLISKYLDRIENLVGKINLEGVYQKLLTAKLFIGHDSSIGHLATFASCKTLTISLGTVRPIETTPYGEDTYCIVPATKCFPCNPTEDCSLFQCHLDIPYQTINGLINVLLSKQQVDEKTFKEQIPAFLLSASKVYKMAFNVSGFAELQELFSNDKNETEVMKLIYRMLWQYSFGQTEEDIKFPQISKSAFDILFTALKGLEHIYELCHFGKKFSQYILEEIANKTPNLNSIKTYSDKIDELNDLLDIIKSNYSLLSPLIHLHKVGMANVPGRNLVEITESTHIAFVNLENSSSVIYELVEKILIESKHKNISPRPSRAQGDV